MPEPAIEVVLFDLGGVLFDFGGVQPMKSLSGIEHDDEIWRRWLGCRWVRTFERGSCSAEQFAEGVVGDWALPIAGADVLVREARNKVKVGCLSNTNALHWTDHENRWELLSAFDFRFLSFQMGYVKPDREIFDRTAQLLDRPRDRVLFLDDNAINVEGARAAGFHAMQAVGVDEARRCLMAVDLLPEG